MKTKHGLLAILLIVALLATACNRTAPPAAEEQQEGDPTATSDFSFALVTPNPRGDRSFIDAAAIGAERAISELKVNGSIIEARGVSEQEQAIRGAIGQDNDLVLTLAPEPDIILNLAEEFPDQRFGVPSDIFVEALPDNVAAFQINVHEGSFLAGIAAGMLTQTKKVGAVVGGDSPGLNQFFWAYKQGVLEVCPDCEVEVGYLGFDFSNPTLGKETALAQYEAGADIIFQIAGRSGEGVISAAQEQGKFAIGVDSNQDDIAPGSVIVSMMKRVDQTTFLLVQNALEGNFKGGFSVIGMQEGATALSWDEGSTTFEQQGPAELTSKLPDVKARVEEYRARILDGSFQVCDALADSATQQAACDAVRPS